MGQGPGAWASGRPALGLLEAGKGARGAARAPTPQSFLLVIHPSPIRGLFSPDSFVSPLSSCPRLRGWRGRHGGVPGGWLSSVASQNPRLSVAHLSFSFSTFSALGSGGSAESSRHGLGGELTG